MDFKTLLEKQERNRLRKQALASNGYSTDHIKTTTKEYKRVYENQGVQVFVDENYVDPSDYERGKYNYRMVDASVRKMLIYLKDLLPNRKPKIVISELDNHPITKDINAAGAYYDGVIFIDKNYIDQPEYYIHEYAHWLEDTVPRQSKQMIKNAFDSVLKMYYSAKKKRIKTHEEISDAEREKIAKHFGFDRYGFTNPAEFFAVLIENWKNLPNNKIMYQFKSKVKQLISRL